MFSVFFRTPNIIVGSRNNGMEHYEIRPYPESEELDIINEGCGVVVRWQSKDRAISMPFSCGCLQITFLQYERRYKSI